MAEHPFARVPNAVLDHADLDAHELLVYIALLRHRDPKTGRCFPGLQTIADVARVSRKTASRTVKRLEDKGIIKVERVKAVGSLTNESNRYTVGLLPDDPMKYLGQSAKGRRVPTRSKAVDNSAESKDSESLPNDEASPSRDSESGGRDSESLRVGTRSPTKKNQLKKIHEEALTHDFEEAAFESVSFETSEDRATNKQVAYLKDLALHLHGGAGYGVPDLNQQVTRWQQLTTGEATSLIRQYLKSLGRPEEHLYPEYGTPEYEALSPAGKEFADTGGMPDSVYEYGFMRKENAA